MALIRTANAGGDIFNLLSDYTITQNEHNTTSPAVLTVSAGDIIVGGVRSASAGNGDISTVSSGLELLSDSSTTGTGHDYGIWKATTNGSPTIAFTNNVQWCLCVLHKTT